MKLETLLKKKADLEAQIEVARKAENRKQAVGGLAEKAGVLDCSDSQILAALQKLAGRPAPEVPPLTGG